MATRIIASSEIRFAVLDYSVGSANTVEMAEALSAAGIPALFLTAYGKAVELPESLAHMQVLAKPFSTDLLAEAILKEIDKVLAATPICRCG
jgi:two-component SAPR family response regulator